MASAIEKFTKWLKIKFPQMFYVHMLSKDNNGMDIEFNGDLSYNAKNAAQDSGHNVQGDAAANGTTVATYNLAAGSRLAITYIDLSANGAYTLRLATGALGATTDLISFRFAAAGMIGRTSEKAPLIVIDNSAGAAVLVVQIYAPNAVEGGVAGSNNPVGAYFNAAWSGVLL